MQRNLGHLLSLLHERSAKWLSAELAAAGLKGLAPSHGDILARLFAQDGATMHELAAFARRTKPTTTILVDKLEALGCVSREPSPADARSTVVRLTPAGEALRPAFDDISRRYVRFLYAGLSPAEAATLERLLSKTLDATENPNHQEKHP
jgi:DNA-binding MarR family transcriptional regulator